MIELDQRIQSPGVDREIHNAPGQVDKLKGAVRRVLIAMRACYEAQIKRLQIQRGEDAVYLLVAGRLADPGHGTVSGSPARAGAACGMPAGRDLRSGVLDGRDLGP